MRSFEQVYGKAPAAVGAAPGRVNLLGEHTDYNEGYVLPIAIAQQTRVAIRRADTALSSVYAQELDESASFSLEAPPPEQFAKYVYGCLAELQAAGFAVPPLDLHVASEVPIGVGLSSSAALEVATLRAVRSLLALPLDDVRIAQLAQRAEVFHAGVRCGILDQMAASLADTRHALLLDTRTLERQRVRLPAGSAILVLDSGVARALASSGYNARRAECEEAARQLGVASLRDLQAEPDWQRIEALPDPLGRRVRHVLSENSRVLQAAECTEAPAFGALMNASHASLRHDYEVSVLALDRLVALLQQAPGVHGARLTGAGFGGACVALVKTEAVDTVGAQVLAQFAEAGGRGRRLVPA
jgi:galactokinase